MADICLAEHFDAVCFSKYLSRLDKDIQPLAQVIYDSAENCALYCPEIRKYKDTIIFSWINDGKSLQVVIKEGRNYVRYLIKDIDFRRNFSSSLEKTKIQRMFLELSLFIYN